MRSRALLFRLLAPALAAGLLLGACDEAEQGRILNYEKGTYLGEPDQKLSEEDRNKLIQRARQQRGV